MPLRKGLGAVEDDAEDEQTVTWAQILAKLGSVERKSRAIILLKNKQPVRDAHLRQSTYGSINFSRTHNYEALLIRMTGQVAAQPCRVCAKKRGRFAECVVSTQAGFGACANCHYNSNGPRCNYHFRKSGGLSETSREHVAPRETRRSERGSKRGRVNREPIHRAGHDSAGNSINVLRAVSPTDSDDSYTDTADGQPPDPTDSEHSNPDQRNGRQIRAARGGSRHGQGRTRSGFERPPDAMKIEDESDDGGVDPSQMNMIPNHTSDLVPAPPSPAGIAAPFPTVMPHARTEPAMIQPAPPVGRSVPPGNPQSFQISVNTNLPYHDKRRMAWLCRALGDAFDAAAEQELG